MKKVEELLDDSIAKEQEEHGTRERSGKINPSSLGQCYRRQFLNRKNVVPSNPPDQRTLRVFKCGNIFEDFVVNLLPQDMEKQVLIEDEDLKGYADLVHEDWVGDIKSQHSRAFWYMTKSDNIARDKFANILQVMTYAHYLDKKVGKLIFVSKDDLCIQEYTFHIDADSGTESGRTWREEVLREINNDVKIWEMDKLPPAQPRLYKQKDGKFKECSYCQFKDTCKSIENGEINPREMIK